MNDKRKPGLQFRQSIQVGERGVLDIDSLRAVAQKDPKRFTHLMQKLIDSGELRWSKVRSLQRLFLALADVQVPVTANVMGHQRNIMASAFPLLAGALTVAGINEEYESYPTIGQELVTDMEDNKRFSQISNPLSLDVNVDQVKEGDDFPLIGASEEKFTIAHKRNGRRLAITAEAIEENDLALVQRENMALAQIASERIEEQTLERVTDHYGSGSTPAEPYAMRLNGAGTQLYNATANNPGTRAPSGTRVNNNRLVDSTDLEAARVVLAAMLNSRGKRISNPVSRMTLLVPDALDTVASKILNSVLEPGVENEYNDWGPSGRRRPRLLSSPKLDDLSTSAWYLGNFPMQFTRKWKLRLEYVTLQGDMQKFLESRVAFQARIAWDVEIGATDYVWVVQSLAGTTAPVDE